VAAVQLCFRFGAPQGAIKTAVRDAALESLARVLMQQAGSKRIAALVEVWWNPRLRSTAGRAIHSRSWDTGAEEWRVELNPRLQDLDPAETEKTLRHELAHLIADDRAGRRKIEPHGPEWRRACRDIGIPDEAVTHSLPLPRNEMRRKLVYQCPHCHEQILRVRPISRGAACGKCCEKWNRGEYDERFMLQRVSLAARK
jgi:SprT protein